MNLIDLLLWGWYQILDKTIYSYGTRDPSLGPREHSFFITFLFHGINVGTFFSFLIAKYFNATIRLFPSLALAGIIYGIGYLVYFSRGRINKVVSYNANIFRTLFFIFLSLVYAIASVYFMFQVGDYVRAKMPQVLK